MKRRIVSDVMFLSVLGGINPVVAQEIKSVRPNFVWFMTEDVSSYFLDIYNEGRFGAVTPHVKELARGGLVFNNAYSNAPVSSAARSTLITGCYAPRIGVHLHRKMECRKGCICSRITCELPDIIRPMLQKQIITAFWIKKRGILYPVRLGLGG